MEVVSFTGDLYVGIWHCVWHWALLSVLQAAPILVAMASEKKFWRPKFWRKSPIGDQQIKRETYLSWKIINNRTNFINSTSGSITCLSLFPSRRSETRHECVNLPQQRSVENVRFGALALRVIRHEVSSPFMFFLRRVKCHEVSSPSRFFLFLATEFFYGDHFAIKGHQKATFWKSELGALALYTTKT